MQSVSKKVNVGSMLSWHDLTPDAIPNASNIETDIPIDEYPKGK